MSGSVRGCSAPAGKKQDNKQDKATLQDKTDKDRLIRHYPQKERAMENQDAEIWKPVKSDSEPFDIGNFYEVSTAGNIRKKGSQENLKPSELQSGYLAIGLNVQGWNKNFRLHRLIAETFLTMPPGKLEVNHKNGKKDDNRAVNLEWCTSQYNTQHAIDNGLRTRMGGAKLSESDVLEIRRLRSLGIKRKVVADQFGVSVFNIKAIDLRKSWRHI